MTAQSERASSGLRVQAPLAFQQEWALNHWMQKGFPFVAFFSAYLRGPFDANVFQKSVSMLIERHQSLRIGFVEISGLLTQVACGQVDCKVTFEKITACEHSSVEVQAKDLLQRFSSEQMDISVPPLMEIRVFELGVREQLLAVKVHHLVTDGVSQMLFFRELWSLYGDLIKGKGHSLHNVPLQYLDYAAQQRIQHPEWLMEHRGYWEKKLSNASPVRAPVETGLRTGKSGRSASQEIELDQALSLKLFGLARQERTTPAMLMLALYSVVIRLWCDQIDFVVPFAVSGRWRSEQTRTMGYFAHYLPLRITVDDKESLAELLRRVVAEFSHAQGHLDAGRITNDDPSLFQGTSLNWVPAELILSTPQEWSGRSDCPTIEPFPLDDHPHENFKLPCETHCVLINTREGIRGAMYYRADLLKSANVERFCEAMRALSENVGQRNLAPLSSIYKEMGW